MLLTGLPELDSLIGKPFTGLMLLSGPSRRRLILEMLNVADVSSQPCVYVDFTDGVDTVNFPHHLPKHCEHWATKSLDQVYYLLAERKLRGESIPQLVFLDGLEDMVPPESVDPQPGYKARFLGNAIKTLGIAFEHTLFVGMTQEPNTLGKIPTYLSRMTLHCGSPGIGVYKNTVGEVPKHLIYCPGKEPRKFA